MTYTLTAEPRTTTGSKASKKLRAAGRIPAVVYGAVDNGQAVTVTTAEFEKVWHEAGESSIVSLTGLGKELSVLIHDVSTDPLYGTPTHVDLYAVRTDQAVEVAVPLVFAGVAPAEKELGGTLIKVMHELEIEALPKDLPHEITVDISQLKTFDDQIHVRDVALPKGVTAVADADEVVALVQEAVEVTEEAAGPADLSAIEVEKKGKEEEPAE